MPTQNGTRQTQPATTRSSANTGTSKSKPPAAAQPVTAVKKFSGWLKANYGYTPLRATQQQAVQAYYGLKEGLGLACQTRLTSANASTAKFWADWNNGGFSDLVGQPTKITISLQEMAELAIEYMPGLAHLADAEPEEVIAELAQLNRISTAERNDRTALVRELAKELAKLPPVSVGQEDEEPFAPSTKRSTAAGFTEGSDDDEGDSDEDEGEDFDEEDGLV